MANYITNVTIDGTQVNIKDAETSNNLTEHINANNPHHIQVGGRNLYYLKDFSLAKKNDISDSSVKSGEITVTASNNDMYFGDVAYDVHEGYNEILGPLMYVEGASFLTISISNSDFNKNYYNFFDKDKKALAGPLGPVDRITTLSVPSDAVYFTLRVGNGHAVAGTTYKTRVKVERGNIPTDWTPALEDLETTAITNANIDSICV